MANSNEAGSNGSDVGSNSPSTSQGGSQAHSRSLRRSIVGSKEEALRIASGNVNQLSKAKSHLAAKGYLTQGSDISHFDIGRINPTLQFKGT